MKMEPIFLMAQPGSGGSPAWTSFIFIGLMFVVFYFFMIRPQYKKQKDQNKFRENIKKGDRIITIGGVHGKIAEIGDKTFIIEVEGGNRLKIEKSAISMENSVAIQNKD